VCCPQLTGHAPSNRGTPDRHTAPSSRDVASPPVPRRPRGGGSGPAPWQGAGHNRRPHPPPDPRPRGVVEVDLRTGSGPTHTRVALRTARAGVARPPHPRYARGPDPSSWAQTHTPVLLAHHVRLRDSSPLPRDVSLRGSRDEVFADSFPLPPHDVPSPPPLVVPVASCFCRSSGAPSPPRSFSRRVPPPLSPARGAGGRPTTRRPRPCRPL